MRKGRRREGESLVPQENNKCYLKDDKSRWELSGSGRSFDLCIVHTLTSLFQNTSTNATHSEFIRPHQSFTHRSFSITPLFSNNHIAVVVSTCLDRALSR